MASPSSPNYAQAVFSFLRVLAVALASAVLPFVTSSQSDEVPVRAVLYAVAGAFLLTVVNFFRAGEPRFGTPPNPGADDGTSDVGLIFAFLLVFAVIAFLFAGNVTLAVVLAVVALLVFFLA